MDFGTPSLPLDVFFRPRRVAVLGADERTTSPGRSCLSNLISSPFGGTVYPVNPSLPHVLGVHCHSSLADIPGPGMDLAIVAGPDSEALTQLRSAIEHRVPGITFMPDLPIPRELVAMARANRTRILGGSSLGVLCPLTGLNASYAARMAEPGNVAFLSQSASLCTSVLDWSLDRNVGFAAFVSTGRMADIDWGDLLDYFGMDTKTRGILVYLESIQDARSFLSAAREASLAKPVLALFADSDPVLERALARCGVLRVSRVSDLFYMAELLAKQPRPRGPRLMILTNASGPAQLARQALVGTTAAMAELSPATRDALDQILPNNWSRANPVDLLHDATPERFARVLEIAARSSDCDGLLVILSPHVMNNPTAIAEAVRSKGKGLGKPILASWMGGASVAAGRNLLNEAGIPAFPYPDTAAHAFEYMWRYSANLHALYETPSLATNGVDTSAASGLLDRVRQSGRTELSEDECRQLFAKYQLDLDAPFSIYLGSRIDPRFGPYLLLGLGNRLARLMPNREPSLPPLNTTLAQRWLDRTPLPNALDDAFQESLVRTMVRFSHLVAEQRLIAEVDIELGVGMLRVALHPPGSKESDWPRLAIRPYPAQYASAATLKDGRPYDIRPIRPEDEPLMVAFHESLSDRTVYQRYLQVLKLEQRVLHERLTRICFNDYDRELALVAEIDSPRRIIAVGRLQKLRGVNEAEIAVVVADDFQSLGVGSNLLKRVVEIARLEKIDRLWADILADNRKMQRLCESMGFQLESSLGDPTVSAYLDLKS